MCGIVAYIGSQAAYPIILKGLKRLEYRGYDSAGIALYGKNITNFKKKAVWLNLKLGRMTLPKRQPSVSATPVWRRTASHPMSMHTRTNRIQEN